MLFRSEAGILPRVLGGVPFLASFENVTKAEAAGGLPADPVQRFAALGVWLSEDGERLTERLRLSNAEHERLVSMGDGWWRVTPSDEKAARALLYRLGPQRFADRVLIAWARSREGAADKAWKNLLSLPDHWIVPVFPLKSADFVARGVAKGPALGAAMRAAEDAWVAADFPSDATAVAARSEEHTSELPVTDVSRMPSSA